MYVVSRLEFGATLKNVILGADSIEHDHCIGDGCTISVKMIYLYYHLQIKTLSSI